MSVNDPISDMLTRIRNGGMARKSEVTMPSTKVLVAIAGILKSEGYIGDYAIIEKRPQNLLKISLRYGVDKQHTIREIRRVSKPGLRVYAKSTNLPKVLGGLGVAIISTSSGLLTDKQAAQKGVGGEVLAYVW